LNGYGAWEEVEIMESKWNYFVFLKKFHIKFTGNAPISGLPPV
jgi:hypothetical protein